MLNKLRTLFIVEGYYFENEIKSIDHSCCSSCTIKVLDFDKVKDEFCKNIGITDTDKLKSVDVMYLSPTENMVNEC